jgi:hypothetical protein
MTRARLRKYLGNIPWADIERRMDSGRIPRPLWGVPPSDKNARWDQKAVDRTIDGASQIPASIEDHIRDLDKAFGFR